MKTIIKVLPLIAILVFAAGCASEPKRRPLYLSSRFDPQQIQTITVLQPLDLRYDKSLKTDYVDILGTASKRALKSRKYKVVLNEEPSFVAGISEADLEKPPSDWIKNLGPKDANWIMLPSVEYVTRFTAGDAEAIAEVRGVLFDKTTGSVVWRGVGKGFMHIGILFGGLADNDAVRMAAFDMTCSLPRKKDNIAEYQNLEDPLTPLEYDKETLPEKGMTKAEIQALFGETGKILSHDQGETWYYHLNMANAFMPFTLKSYHPEVWVFHFDTDGRLINYHFTDKRIYGM